MATPQLSHPIALNDYSFESAMRFLFRGRSFGLLCTTALLLLGCGSDNGATSTTSGGSANNTVGGNSATGGIASALGGASSGGSPNVGGGPLGGSSMVVAAGGNSAGGVTVGGSSTANTTLGGNSAGGSAAGGSSAACCTLSDSCNTCLLPLKADGVKLIPPCESLTGNDPIYGIANKDLCKAVLSCVIDTKCFDWAGTESTTACYCGTAPSGEACLAKGVANGPCRTQIEQGMGSEDPSTILLAGLTDPNLPAGLALVIAQTAYNECTVECSTDFLSAAWQTSGTGGAPGGAPGTGGARSSGGAGGAGGTGQGGSTNGGGTSTDPCPIFDSDTMLFDFLSSTSGLLVDKSSDYTSSSLNLTYTADGTAQFSSSDADAGSELVDVVSWDSAIGDPSPGSASLDVPFSASLQSFEVSAALSAPPNLTGKTLFACVRLDKGLYPSPDFILNTNTCSTIGLVVKDSLGHVSRPRTTLCPSDTGSWKQLTLKLTLSTVTDPNDSTKVTVTFDPTQIVAVGVQVNTQAWRPAGGATTPLPDKPQTATLHIDSIGYR